MCVADHVYFVLDLSVALCLLFITVLLLTANKKINTQKQIFGPRTAKSQPIWIKFCTHLLLYGIHFWADLDRDRRVGGCKTTMLFCNTCNAP